MRQDDVPRCSEVIGNGTVLIGMGDGKGLTDALQLYTLLTIGDGLVSQVPALIIATSAGILVTKSSSDSNLGDEIGEQVMQGHRAMFTGALILSLMVFVPGLPKFPFLLMAGLVFAMVSRAKKAEVLAAQPKPEDLPVIAEESPDEKNLNEFIQNDRIVIEIGAGLIHLVEPKKGKGIVDRVTTLRRDIGSHFGFWVPSVRIRDNLQIDVLEYRIIVGGIK